MVCVENLNSSWIFLPTIPRFKRSKYVRPARNASSATTRQRTQVGAAIGSWISPGSSDEEVSCNRSSFLSDGLQNAIFSWPTKSYNSGLADATFLGLYGQPLMAPANNEFRASLQFLLIFFEERILNVCSA